MSSTKNQKVQSKNDSNKKRALLKGASSKKAQKKSTAKTLSAGRTLPLSKELLLQMWDLMVKSRVLEERLIKIQKSGESYFWIGGPGEEAFGVPLGLLINKGHGPKHDYLHLHYRATPTVLAMGMPMIDAVRMNMNRATDPCTGGRNFSGHYCYPQWNLTPVSSPIEVQYLTALGTGRVQQRHGGKGITIVTGGDAGTAEGDFASCLVWASRPGNELPILITVQNNKFGISTTYETQHGEEKICDRGRAFGMKTMYINGNDPIEAYQMLQEAMEYIRTKRKPVLLEARVSRLYGHSSGTGANFIPEQDPVKEFEQRLMKWGVISSEQSAALWEKYDAEAKAAQEQARLEPAPEGDSVWDHIYADGENADWRKF